jgi:hypothetical protein
MSVILSREAYLEFKCFGMADEYPKSTEQASSELRTRGCDSSVPALNYLIKQGRVQPERNGRNYEWSAADIDHAAAIFEEQGTLTPQANAFLWHGIHADVYFKTLHEEWIKLGDEFGEAAVPLPPNSDYFVSHFHPPRMGLSGSVEFTLCDDSREQLVRLSAANFGVKPLVSLKNPRVRKKHARD